MAETLSDDVGAKPSPAEQAPFFRQAQHEAVPHGRRFGLAYFSLAVCVGVAVGLTIVLLGRSSTSHSAWSRFKPTGHGLAAAQQIASYVGGSYRLGSLPLASALASPPEVQQNVTISAAAVRSGFTDERPQDVTFVKTNHSVVYLFTGTGANGVIPGTPSVARGNLLRREILEMSLYSLKYVDGIDSVIAFPPPTVGSDGKALPRAVLLRRSGLGKLLSRPLFETLPPRRVETTAVKMSSGELAAISKVRFMQYAFQALPNDTALLVLTPVG